MGPRPIPDREENPFENRQAGGHADRRERAHLHYYDELGLLTPSEVTAAGYRLYGDDKLERLQQILFFRELDFPLREIARILDSPDFPGKRRFASRNGC